LIAKWVSGHGMPSSYQCLTSSDVDVSVTSHSSQRVSLLTCRSLSVNASPISSKYCQLSMILLHAVCARLIYVSSYIYCASETRLYALELHHF